MWVMGLFNIWEGKTHLYKNELYNRLLNWEKAEM